MMPDVPGSSSWAERGERRSGGGDDDGPARLFVRCAASFSGARAGSAAPAAVGTSSTGPGRAGAVRAATCAGSGRSVRACSTAGRATCAYAPPPSPTSTRRPLQPATAVRAASAAVRAAGAASARSRSPAVRAAASGSAAVRTRSRRKPHRRRSHSTRPAPQQFAPAAQAAPQYAPPPSRSTHPLRSSSHPPLRVPRSTHLPQASTPRLLSTRRPQASTPRPLSTRRPLSTPRPLSTRRPQGSTHRRLEQPRSAPPPQPRAPLRLLRPGAVTRPCGRGGRGSSGRPRGTGPGPAAAPAQLPLRRAGEGARPAGSHPRASDARAHQGEPIGPGTRNHRPGLAASTGPGARGLPPRLAPAPRLRQRRLHGEGRASALRGGVLPGDWPPRPRLGLRGAKGRARSPLHLLVPHLRRRRRIGRVRDEHRAADELALVLHPRGRQLQPVCPEQLEHQDLSAQPSSEEGCSSAVSSSPGPRSPRTW